MELQKILMQSCLISKTAQDQWTKLKTTVVAWKGCPGLYIAFFP
jgi:hypothetical protein